MRLARLAVIALALAPLVAPPDWAAVAETAPAGVEAQVLEASVTQHEIVVDGAPLAFQARAEMLELVDGDGSPAAHLFTVSYLGDDAEPDRPVTFLMNGGPGAASAYLHVGGVGPWILRTDSLGRPLANGALVENPQTWLAHTDLVFLDPPGTGFSRPVPPDDRRFYDRRADLQSLARVIDLWLDRQGRRAAPIYLAGESYGGYRAAALARLLAHERGIDVAGTILISPVIDFSTIRHHAPRPMSWALLLPSYAAAAAGHGRADAVPADELRAFALEDYVLALIHPERMAALLPRISEITGLEEELLRERRGRVRPSEFRQRLLADEDRLLSAYDGMVAVPRPERTRGRARVDPVLDGMTSAFVTGLLTHLRERLEWPHGRDYRLLNREVNRAWTYGSERAQGYISAMRELQEVMALDDAFRVFAAHGEADLVTPWLATEWLLGQLGDAVGGTPERLVFERYPGGHMFYMRPDANAALSRDIGRFFAGGRITSPASPPRSQ